MKDFVTNFLVSGLMVVLIGFNDCCSKVDLSDPYQREACIEDFISSVNMHGMLSFESSDRDRLDELEEVKEQFLVAPTNAKRKFLVGKALKIIKKLSNSAEIQATEDSRLGFILFAQKELLFFGFNQECIRKFVKTLKWVGRVNGAFVQAKLLLRKAVIMKSDLISLFGIIVFFAKGSMILEEYIAAQSRPVMGINVFKAGLDWCIDIINRIRN